MQNRWLWVRLREKGGKRHEMPCHHNLETYLHAYLDGGGIAADPKGPQDAPAPAERPAAATREGTARTGETS